MHELHKYPVLKAGIELTKKISDLGYETYIAGGCVRDIIRYQMHQIGTLDIHDIDIATAAPMDVLKANFRTESNNGEKHGTVLVFENNIPFEVTHFRTDGKYTDGRHPDSVELASTFKEDAARRDFTINALGMTWKGDIIDYYDGVKDIEHQWIRCVGNPIERFSEDSLRIIRGIRFALNFGYVIDEPTIEGMTACAEKIKNVSNERIRSELMKLDDYNHRLYDFFRLLRRTKVLYELSAFEDVDWADAFDYLRTMKHLTKENVVPALAYIAGGYKTLDGLVATREEKRRYRWYADYNYRLDRDEPLRDKWYWTLLVDFVSGDCEVVLDHLFNGRIFDDERDLPKWLQSDLAKAKYISQNMPNMKDVTRRVQEMNIPEGKEFGEAIAKLNEEQYASLANKISDEMEIRVGNSIIKYKMVDVVKNPEGDFYDARTATAKLGNI